MKGYPALCHLTGGHSRFVKVRAYLIKHLLQGREIVKMKKLTEQELEYLKAKYPNEYKRSRENSLKAYQKKESRMALVKAIL